MSGQLRCDVQRYDWLHLGNQVEALLTDSLRSHCTLEGKAKHTDLSG